MQSGPTELTVQTWIAGSWHDAARVSFHESEKGHLGSTTTTYLLDYFVDHAAVDSLVAPVIDERAVSVALPVGEDRWLPTWPAFLMDMLPQGPARILLAKAIGLNGALPSSETHLLAYAAGTPVGNLRIAEAVGKAARTFSGRGISLSDVLGRTDAFVDFATALPWEAPASVCLQGEWPKLQLTMAADGMFYPDQHVPDADAGQRYIVKLARSRDPRDSLILEIEALYAEAACGLGLPIRNGYVAGPGVLMIPRFDRDAEEGALRRGQESLVSAAGIAAFGHLGTHESYLSLLSVVSSDPAADRLEYVKRDLLNLCLGNDDNHGRNMALCKHDGRVRLSEIFDLAPMRLSGGGVARSTKWVSMKELGSDYHPCWDAVASTVTQDDAERDAMLVEMAALAERLPVAASSIIAKSSDTGAAAHAMSRLEGMVKSVVSAADRVGRGYTLPG